MKIDTGKGGGGLTYTSNTIVPAQKNWFGRKIKGKELRRRSLNNHMCKINKEHASKEVRPF